MRIVTVCAACLRASCWQGEFYCDEYENAGTTELPVDKLWRMALEDPCYWEITPDEQDDLIARYGEE